MAKLRVDGTEIDVPDHYTLLQAAEEAGVEIPRFCFHERLSIAGNCRMCLIEVKGGPPKPTASCAMNVRDLRPGPQQSEIEQKVLAVAILARITNVVRPDEIGLHHELQERDRTVLAEQRFREPDTVGRGLDRKSVV